MKTYDLKDLERYREIAGPIMAAQKRELFRQAFAIDPRSVLMDAPSIMTVLATLPGAATANTYTAAQTLLSSGTTNQTAVGPFSTDYFKTTGATWEQEAVGIISCTGTPTFAMGTYFGTAIAAATVLAITAAQTCISGLANVNWYWNAFGHTRTITASTATILVTGVLIGQIATAAAGNNTIYAVNATPPTAITCDLSTGIVFIDLKGTWSASSASNTTTVNFYNLKSLYA